jgi:hypothetical protein
MSKRSFVLDVIRAALAARQSAETVSYIFGIVCYRLLTVFLACEGTPTPHLRTQRIPAMTIAWLILEVSMVHRERTYIGMTYGITARVVLRCKDALAAIVSPTYLHRVLEMM